MKTLITTLTIAAAFLGNVRAEEPASSPAKEDVYYTCPMKEHADVKEDKPGKCPKCGMKLIKKERAED
jgi:DNA-directed RNA polymerase subunit RPC12/RpoP